MENNKAIMFIDGNNWYHNAKNWFSKLSDVGFVKLGDLICKKFDLNLIKIRYYNSVPSLEDGEAMYYRHMSYLSDLEKRGIKVTTRKLQRNPTKEVVKERKEIIESLDLCDTCKPSVISAFVDSIGKVEKKEKGIDVAIAIDMVKSIINKECDKCILISGDADFIPSIELIKESKGEVIVCGVPMGFSNELKQGKFRYFILKRQELQDNCLKSYKEIKKE